MKLAGIIFLLALLSVGPFVLNASGRSLYLYTAMGEDSDLVLGAAQGVCHLAWGDTLKPELVGEVRKQLDDTIVGEYLDGYVGKTYELGPFTLLVEESDRFRPYRFNVMTEQSYRGVEFPWLLIPITLVALGVWRVRAVSKRGGSA